MTFDFLVLWWKFAKFLKLFSKPNVSFSSNFASLFIVMKDNSFVLFQVKHYVLCTKGNNQSATFWDFRVLGSKFTKFLSFFKKEISVSSNFTSLFSVMRQNSSLFCSWNFIYFQQKQLIKDKFGEISCEHAKVWNFALWWAPLSNSYKV